MYTNLLICMHTGTDIHAWECVCSIVLVSATCTNPNYSLHQTDTSFTHVRRNSLVCMCVYQFDHMHAYRFIWETGIRFKKFTSTCSLSQLRRWNDSSPAVNCVHRHIHGLPEHALHAIFFVSCLNQLIPSFFGGPLKFALMVLLWCCLRCFRSSSQLKGARVVRKRWERHCFHSQQGPGRLLWAAEHHTSLAMFYCALKNEDRAKNQPVSHDDTGHGIRPIRVDSSSSPGRLSWVDSIVLQKAWELEILQFFPGKTLLVL